MSVLKILWNQLEKRPLRDEHSISDHEYEEEFLEEFNFDLEILSQESKEELLNNTRKYYLTALEKFDNYICYNTIIFKYLQVLDFNNAFCRNKGYWKSILSKFKHVVGMFNFVSMKSELSQLFNLTDTELNEIKAKSKDNSILGWKVIKDNYNTGDRFKNLLNLVKALYSLPYGNADVERSFNQLKMIKHEKRLLLSNANLNSLMVLNNMTKKRKIGDFNGILKPDVLKRVRLDLDAYEQKAREIAKTKKITVKLLKKPDN